VRRIGLGGADLEGESPQGNEAGKFRQDGEDAFPVKGVRVRDEYRRDVRREVRERGKGGRNRREDVAPRGDPDVVGESREAGRAFDGAKKCVGRESPEIELPLERTEDVGRKGFRGKARRRGEPSERDSVVEADENVSEVDEEGAQKPPLQGRASWPVRR
jgi:hypothetical protein